MISNYYKVLDGDTAIYGAGKWHKPQGKRPGKWMPKLNENLLRPCVYGYHLCRDQDLIYWLHKDIYVAECKGKVVVSDDKVVVAQARLTMHMDTWDECAARLFAADCAEHVLPIFEKEHPNDDRPRKAIEAARKYANGKIGAAAGAAARAAAWDAAGAAEKKWQTTRLMEYLEGARQ